jgi:hypothetical protein
MAESPGGRSHPAERRRSRSRRGLRPVHEPGIEDGDASCNQDSDRCDQDHSFHLVTSRILPVVVFI